jgi:serine/threonine protein phosphatase PrpC
VYTAEPEITEHTLGPDDTFMILASDGVWEFISSQEAVDKVAGSLDKGCMRATQVLIEAAAQRWREVEGDYRDGMIFEVSRSFVAVLL